MMAHSKLGLAFKEKGDLESAKEEYLIALRLDPNSSSPPYMLSRIYSLQEDFGRAREFFRQTVALDSELAVKLYREPDLAPLRGR